MAPWPRARSDSPRKTSAMLDTCYKPISVGLRVSQRLAVLWGVRLGRPSIFRCMPARRATGICSSGAGFGLHIYLRQGVDDEGASAVVKRSGGRINGCNGVANAQWTWKTNANAHIVWTALLLRCRW